MIKFIDVSMSTLFAECFGKVSNCKREKLKIVYFVGTNSLKVHKKY